MQTSERPGSGQLGDLGRRGILFWTGRALPLVQLHKLVGVLFVVSLLTLVVLAARAAAPPTPVIALAVVALVIPVVGFVHMRLMPGASHWIVQVVHLLLGLSAMPLAGVLPVLVEGRRAHTAAVGRRAATASDHGALERGTP